MVNPKGSLSYCQPRGDPPFSHIGLPYLPRDLIPPVGPVWGEDGKQKVRRRKMLSFFFSPALILLWSNGCHFLELDLEKVLEHILLEGGKVQRGYSHFS